MTRLRRSAVEKSCASNAGVRGKRCETVDDAAGGVAHVRMRVDGGQTRVPYHRVAGSILANRYAVASDGRRFLFLVPVEEEARSPITVVLHWTSGANR